jgi:hypothetical protein
MSDYVLNDFPQKGGLGDVVKFGLGCCTWRRVSVRL